MTYLRRVHGVYGTRKVLCEHTKLSIIEPLRPVGDK